ncbi:MAG: AAA family ATPase [Candidatus Dormiibacterota bacterium]
MTPDPDRGQIIFLNGTTSSGKTSLAKALLPILPEPFFYLSVDSFNSMRDQRYMDAEELSEVLERTVRGFHRAVTGMVGAGNNVVVDHVLRERSWLIDCLNLFDGGDVVFVGVHCALPELERRERLRGDRVPGRAAYQLERVHAHTLYDVECATDTNTPSECAEPILSAVTSPSVSRAFDRMQAGDRPS